MKKRVISLLIIAALGASLLSGCGCSRKDQKAVTINLENLKKAEKRITQLMEGEDYKKASEEEKLEMAKAVVDKLVEQDVVVEETVTVLEEEGVVTFQYQGGGAATIETKPIEELTETTKPTVSASEIQSTAKEIEKVAEEAGATVVEEKEEIPVTKDPEAEWSKSEQTVPDVVVDPRPEEFTLRIYNAFEDDSYRNNNYRMVLENLKQNGVSMSYVEYDDEVMVEDLLEIDDYSMVSFSMHGTYSWADRDTIVPVMVLMDDIGSEERNDELQEYIANYEVIVYHGDSGIGYAITPFFFANNMKKNSLENTIVYSESCCFLGACTDSSCDRYNQKYCNTGSTLFVDAFYKLGSPAIAGFHNSVMANYALNGLSYFANAMYAGYTPEMAYSIFINDYGLTDWPFRQYSSYENKPIAYMLLYGNNITITAADMISKTSKEEAETEVVPVETEIQEPIVTESESPEVELVPIEIILEEALYLSFYYEGLTDVCEITAAEALVDLIGMNGTSEIGVAVFTDQYMIVSYAFETLGVAYNNMEYIYSNISGDVPPVMDEYVAYYPTDSDGNMYTLLMDEISYSDDTDEYVFYRVTVFADINQFN